jgi:hypothetical protein
MRSLWTRMPPPCLRSFRDNAPSHSTTIRRLVHSRGSSVLVQPARPRPAGGRLCPRRSRPQPVPNFAMSSPPTFAGRNLSTLHVQSAPCTGVHRIFARAIAIVGPALSQHAPGSGRGRDLGSSQPLTWMRCTICHSSAHREKKSIAFHPP